MNPPPVLRSQQNLHALRRLQAFELGCVRLLGGWLPGVAGWEVKHVLGVHLWEDAQHSRELRSRLWELRVPDPDRELGPEVGTVVRCIGSAQHDYEFIAGLYLGLKTALAGAYEELIRTTHAVYDAPTVPVLRRLAAEKRAQLQWAAAAVESLSDTGEKKRLTRRWVEFVGATLRAAGGVTGEAPRAEAPTLPPGYDLPLPFAEARRDPRFQLSLGGLPLPPAHDRLARTVYQFFNYTQEMQAAETLGSVLWEAEGMAWDFYFDVARHCHDEVRHSKLGESRLAELGHAVTDFPNSVANYAWRQLYDPLRRYCILTYVIESDSFAYKHQTYQDYLATGDHASAEAVLYDIIDETLHVRWGQKWVPQLMARAGYGGTIETLVAEAREILGRHTVNPLQRAANAARTGDRAGPPGAAAG
jgi:hypothetical protein